MTAAIFGLAGVLVGGAPCQRAAPVPGAVGGQQLAMGRHFERWAWDAEEKRASVGDQRFHAGFVEALRQIAAHCRQGDWLPGGAFYDDTTGGRV
jgi:hypothetical protein